VEKEMYVNRLSVVAIAALIIMTTTNPAVGQDCNALVTHGLRNVEILKSSDAMVATKFYRNCGLDYSSRSDDQMASLEVEVFGYGKGGGAYSRQQREEALRQWCVQNESTAQRAGNLYRESQTIFSDALQAWTSCNALLQDKIQTSPQVSADQRTVDLSVRYTGPGEPLFYGVEAENFTCDTRIPGLTNAQARQALTRGVKLGPSAISINCRRNPAAARTVDGQTYQWLDRGTISVRTVSFPYQLFFAEQTDPALPARASARIESRLNEMSRLLVPVGAVVGFAISAEEAAALAPSWLPADGRIVNDVASPLNGRALPNMIGRMAIGVDPTKSAVDNAANTGGSRTIDQGVEITGRTAGMEVNHATLTGFDHEVHNLFANGNVAVWDTTVPERGADHTHQLTGTFRTKTEMPWQPYRGLIYLVRTR
jgi:hypothetical protein